MGSKDRRKMMSWKMEEICWIIPLGCTTPRVGRFFAVDPLTKEYPNYTPYSFSGNKVIAIVEQESTDNGIKPRENVK